MLDSKIFTIKFFFLLFRLEGAVFESQKMGHVNLDALISDCKNAFQCVQMLLPIEEDSLIRVISTVV